MKTAAVCLLLVVALTAPLAARNHTGPARRQAGGISPDDLQKIEVFKKILLQIKQAPVRWNYKVIDVRSKGLDASKLQELLNSRAGQKGYELVAVQPLGGEISRFIFKSPTG